MNFNKYAAQDSSLYFKEQKLSINPLVLPKIGKIKNEKDSQRQSFSKSLKKKIEKWN